MGPKGDTEIVLGDMEFIRRVTNAMDRKVGRQQCGRSCKESSGPSTRDSMLRAAERKSWPTWQRGSLFSFLRTGLLS